MASGIKNTAGTDLDALFAVIGASTKRADVGFIVANGSGIQGDISNRYFASTGGDTIVGTTSLKMGLAGPDLGTLFRDIAYVAGPVITVQPVAATRNVGASMTLSVTATGTGTLYYLWKRDVGAGYVTAPGTATNSSYTISSLVAGDQGSYKCTVTDNVGSTDTTPALETVNFLPSFSTNPANGTVNETNAASFTVVVTVGQPSPFTYAWQRRLSGGSFATINNTTDSGKYTGTTLATLSFAAAPSDHNSDYRCVATNSVGGTTSNSANLSVNYVPIITTQPVAAIRTVGGSITFSVVAHGTGTLTYQWRKNSVGIGGATSASYTNSSIVLGDVGSYDCVVTGTMGSVTSSSVALHLKASITVNPTNLSEISGSGPDAISVTATGEPTIAYQWYKNGSLLSGATGNQHVMSPGTTSDNGSYFCRVTNAYGYSDSSTATVTWTNVAPSISTQPSGFTHTVNTGPYALTVVASGYGTLQFQWFKNGSSLAAAHIGNISGTSDQHVINPGALTDTGSYYCQVTSAYGTTNSSTVTATFVDIAPVITGGSVTGGPYYFTVGVNVAAFGVTASGLNLSYQWSKNGTAISGATSSSYSLGLVSSPTQSGAYSVVVTNTGGTDSDSASLTVSDVTIVVNSGASSVDVSPPTYNFADGGSIANFVVSTSAGTNIVYVWKKNGSILSGYATNQGPVYNPAYIADSGTYSVEMTNGQGTVTASAIMNVT